MGSYSVYLPTGRGRENKEERRIYFPQTKYIEKINEIIKTTSLFK